MPLVFSAISAHTPLLMPTIGKEAGLKALDKTVKAMQQLEQEMYLSHPEVVLIISPHGNALPDALTINLNSKYLTNFQDFGDLVTRLEYKPETMLIDRIREDFKSKHLPLVLESTASLDYGTAVPLYYLAQHLENIRIVPFYTTQLDMKTHFDAGKELKDEIMSSTKRIAVIASADLSHRLTEKAPGGYSKKGVEFDEKIRSIIDTGNLVDILDIDEAWVSEAQACGAKTIAMLFGMLEDVGHKTKILSYESPFGVGYLVADVTID